ncbi:MAG: hypothetical protein ACYDGY_03250 [Acidimicrobiales bacterium]
MSISSLFKPGDLRLRLAVAAVIVVLVVGIGLVDANVSRAPASPLPGSGGNAASAVVVASAAQSVEWSCPGGTGHSGPAPASIVLTSSRPTPVPAKIRVVSTAGLERFSTVMVPALGQVSVALASILNGPFLGAYILVDGGGVGASEVDSGFTGWSAAPCVSHGADQWYFADGSTAGGDRLFLELLNPGTTPAVVNLSFGSGASAVLLAPSAYQGIVVPPSGLVVENLGHHAVARVPLSTVVTATSGVVTAAELQVGATGGSTIPADGMALTLGSPFLARRWWFPMNWDQAGSVVAFHVFNPGAKTVKISAVFTFSGGRAGPLHLSVKPRSIYTMLAENIPGLPTSVPYELRLKVTHGTGVMADSSLGAPPSASPRPLFDMAPSFSIGARRWLVPELPLPATGEAAIGIADLGGKPAHVTVKLLTQGEAAGTVHKAASSLGAGGGIVVASQVVKTSAPLVMMAGDTLPSSAGSAVLIVQASRPVAVVIDAEPSGTLGVVTIPALMVGS